MKRTETARVGENYRVVLYFCCRQSPSFVSKPSSIILENFSMKNAKSRKQSSFYFVSLVLIQAFVFYLSYLKIRRIII